MTGARHRYETVTPALKALLLPGNDPCQARIRLRDPSVVHAGDQLAAAQYLHGSPREPDLVARVTREEHLVARLDTSGLGTHCGDDAGPSPDAAFRMT